MSKCMWNSIEKNKRWHVTVVEQITPQSSPACQTIFSLKRDNLENRNFISLIRVGFISPKSKIPFCLSLALIWCWIRWINQSNFTYVLWTGERLQTRELHYTLYQNWALNRIISGINRDNSHCAVSTRSSLYPSSYRGRWLSFCEVLWIQKRWSPVNKKKFQK